MNEKLLKLKSECFDIGQQIKYFQNVYNQKMNQIQNILLEEQNKKKETKKKKTKKK